MSVRRRWVAVAVVVGSTLPGLTGCGGRPNEEGFAATPGYAPADAPKTAEEYEQRYNPLYRR